MHAGCGQPGTGRTQAESLAEGTQASRRQDGGAPTAGSLALSFLTPPGFSLPLLLRANDTEDSRRPWARRMRVGWFWGTTRLQGAGSWATQVLLPVPPCPGSTPSGMSLGTWGPRSPSHRGDANAARPEGQ